MASTSASPRPSSSSPPAPPGANLTVQLLFHVDILLLSFLGLCFLIAVPRMLARLTHMSEWTDVLYLRSYRDGSSGRREFSEDTLRRPRIDKTNSELTVNKRESQAEVIEVQPMGSSRQTLSLPVQTPPKHVPTLSTIFPGISWLLSMSVRPGYTVGKLVLMLAYFGVMLYAGIYKSNPFTNPTRAGLVATSQVPLVFVVATKNNIVSALTGYGYEKLNWIHRFVGRFIVLAVNVHALSFMYELATAGTWKEDTQHPLIRWGLLALVCMDLLFLFSISVFRQMFYNGFYITHVISAVVMLAAVWKHAPVNIGWPYAAAAVAVYGLDRGLRVVRTRVAVAHLQPISEMRMVRLSIPKIGAGWRAGDHVRIKVLSTGMGPFGWAESHPFTIASTSKDSEGDGLVLLCKQAGDWTAKLYDLAQSDSDGKPTAGRRVHVLVDGPYGGPGLAMINGFSAAMIVAGGSGVSYGLGTVGELLQKTADGHSAVRLIELAWSIQDPASLGPFLPVLTAFLVRAESLGVTLRVSVSYTRAPRSDAAFFALKALPEGLTLLPGRPGIAGILEGLVNRTLDLHDSKADKGLTGVLVGVCGPVALGESVSRTVRTIPRDKIKAVGGIEIHEESVYGYLSWRQRADGLLQELRMVDRFIDCRGGE
ncbi:hypothetical iron reductase [Postia placenta Mad-698-R]|nr:hypothetical iron reductase [Postia placenta Mad-698-R]